MGPRNLCTLTGRRRLASVLESTRAEFLAHLDGFTLADLLPGQVEARAMFLLPGKGQDAPG